MFVVYTDIYYTILVYTYICRYTLIYLHLVLYNIVYKILIKIIWLRYFFLDTKCHMIVISYTNIDHVFLNQTGIKWKQQTRKINEIKLFRCA
jgi:hypothetical protein